MDYTTLPLAPSGTTEPETVLVVSLYAALQKLSDPRRAQGKRYEMALIVCLLVLAKMAGQKSLSGATEWIRHRGPTLAQRFGLRRARMPCQMTYCNVLSKIDASQLDAILSAFFRRWEAQSRCAEEPSRLQTPEGSADHAHLAIDGKTLRATTAQPQSVHQLSCYEVATGMVLWHCNVQEKQHEISALKPLLRSEVVKGLCWLLGTSVREIGPVVHNGASFLAKVCEIRVQSTQSILCICSDHALIFMKKRFHSCCVYFPRSSNMSVFAYMRSKNMVCVGSNH